MIVEIIKFAENKITFKVPGNNTESTLEKESWVEDSFVKLGQAEITIKKDKISFVSSIADQEAHAKKQGDSNSKNWADEMISFEDLLDAAHKKFKEKLEIFTDIAEDGDGKLLLNYEKKQCLVKAIVKITPDPKKDFQLIYEAHGDAEGITSETIKPHFIRMAETRAIARALRWATNTAKVTEEETSGEPEKKESPKNKK